jgi:hypothetical protein
MHIKSVASSTITRVAIALGASLLLSGCADGPVRPSSPEANPDQVISRIDELSSRPDWLTESKPFMIESGTVVSLGQTEIPSDHRIDAAYRIAQNNADAAIAGAIEKRLEFIFQNAEEGTGFDARQARYIGAQVSRLVTSSMSPGKRYWEKVAYSTDSGRRLTKYRVFTTVEMPEDDFKRAILDALRRAEGKAGLSADFADKVNQQWNTFTAPEVPHVKPASPTASANPT